MSHSKRQRAQMDKLLAEGKLHCACSRIAMRIRCNSPVCALCDRPTGLSSRVANRARKEMLAA